MEKELLKTRKVAELVNEDIKSAHVFKKYGIDFCCGGGVSIEKACEKKQVDLNLLLDELDQALRSTRTEVHYTDWSPGRLIGHIEQVHHRYVRESIPMILQYAAKVEGVHGQTHQALFMIHRVFKALADELMLHMAKEEGVLFPYIQRLDSASGTTGAEALPPFGTVRNPIAMMEQEHDEAGAMLADLEQLTNHFTPPDWACNTFRALYHKLEEFQDDLHLHIHLENNVLFPKALQLESRQRA